VQHVRHLHLQLLGETVDVGGLRQRTLTNLYNQRPTWLDQVHARLDEAVHAAYGWPYPLDDEEILERLIALNLRRSETRGEGISSGEAPAPRSGPTPGAAEAHRQAEVG
jgi:hypothetical protein